MTSTMNYGKICPSRRYNVWKVKIGHEMFVITPAVYPRDKNRAFSHFMDEYEHTDWRIRYLGKLPADDGLDDINLYVTQNLLSPRR
jgi:hypothetical protein